MNKFAILKHYTLKVIKVGTKDEVKSLITDIQITGSDCSVFKYHENLQVWVAMEIWG